MYYGVPDERVMHNVLDDLRLRDIELKDLEKYLNENSRVLGDQFFRDWNDLYCCGEAWLKKVENKEDIILYRANALKNVEQEYALFLKKDFYSELFRYRLDYFIVDVEKQPQINENNFPFLSLEEKIDQFAIYAVIKPLDLLKQ